jgi:hypothetical protein
MGAIRAWACIVLSACSFGGVHCLSAGSFPQVRPLQRTFMVRGVIHADVTVDIKSTIDSPLYRLQCHSAGYSGDPAFDYSGDFECRLSLIAGPNSYSTLLTEDAHQSRDWESRGRFFSAQLRGACARIPEFGASRDFKLRGMDLKLQIIDPAFTEGGKLKSLTLTVTARPDATATRPIAEIVPLPKADETPTACKVRRDFVDSAALAKRSH